MQHRRAAGAAGAAPVQEYIFWYQFTDAQIMYLTLGVAAASVPVGTSASGPSSTSSLEAGSAVPQHQMVLRIFGLLPSSSSELLGLEQTLRDRLNMITLTLLSGMLQRSPRLQLRAADLAFLAAPHSRPSAEVLVALPASVLARPVWCGTS